MFDTDVHMVRSLQALGNVSLILQLDIYAKWTVMTLRDSINILGWTAVITYKWQRVLNWKLSNNVQNKPTEALFSLL